MKWRWVFTLATINNTYLGKKNHFTSILHFPSQSVNTTKKCNFLFVSKNYFIILLYLFDIVQGILQARILEWVACPFSIGSFWPRNWTGVSCIAGGFFTSTELSGKHFIYGSVYMLIQGFTFKWRQLELCFFLYFQFFKALSVLKFISVLEWQYVWNWHFFL